MKTLSLSSLKGFKFFQWLPKMDNKPMRDNTPTYANAFQCFAAFQHTFNGIFRILSNTIDRVLCENI